MLRAVRLVGGARHEGNRHRRWRPGAAIANNASGWHCAVMIAREFRDPAGNRWVAAQHPASGALVFYHRGLTEPVHVCSPLPLWELGDSELTQLLRYGLAVELGAEA